MTRGPHTQHNGGRGRSGVVNLSPRETALLPSGPTHGAVIPDAAALLTQRQLRGDRHHWWFVIITVANCGRTSTTTFNNNNSRGFWHWMNGDESRLWSSCFYIIINNNHELINSDTIVAFGWFETICCLQMSIFISKTQETLKVIRLSTRKVFSIFFDTVDYINPPHTWNNTILRNNKIAPSQTHH